MTLSNEGFGLGDTCCMLNRGAGFWDDASGLFQEHDDPQRVNEQSWHKAQQQKEPKALFPGNEPCC